MALFSTTIRVSQYQKETCHFWTFNDPWLVANYAYMTYKSILTTIIYTRIYDILVYQGRNNNI